MLAIVLSDGQTVSPLAGCSIVEIPDRTPVEEISTRGRIAYTFTGDETTNYPDAFAALRRESAPVMPADAYSRRLYPRADCQLAGSPLGDRAARYPRAQKRKMIATT